MSTLQENKVITWMGRRPEDLSKEELLEAFHTVARMYEREREEAARWRASGNPLSYLMNGAVA